MNEQAMCPGPGVEIDDAGLRLIECAGYLRINDDGTVERTRPAGVYIEQRSPDGEWHPIRGPYWPSLGGYPKAAEDEFRRLAINLAA